MTFLITILAFIVAIGVLVSVHEYGHYRVAKSFGIKILTFSIGFGRPIKSWMIGETRWQIAAIPLGGYVKMLDEREGPVDAAELHRAFNRQSVGRRFAVVVAGPLANLLLAIVVYWGIFAAGVDVITPRIGSVAADSVAAQAGFHDGDTVTALDGTPMDDWSEVRMALIDAAAAQRAVVVDVRAHDGAAHRYQLQFAGIDKNLIDGELAERLGLLLAKVQVGKVIQGSPAQAAGLLEGDQLLALGDRPVLGIESFVNTVKSKPGVALHLRVQRTGQAIDLSVTPRADLEGKKAVGHIGAEIRHDPAGIARLFVHRQVAPLTALRMAVQSTWDMSSFSIRMMWRMVAGHVSVKQLSGPVSIAELAGESAQLGLTEYLRFLCIISISLGVINLLPIPVLDGGHLLYYSAELLRGRPLSERAEELGQRVGVGILAVMMAVALFNDISRLVSRLVGS